MSIPPAIYDEVELSRVTAVDVDSSREIEWRRIKGGAMEQRASMAYEVRDVVLSQGCIIAPPMVRSISVGPLPFWGRYTETEEECALLTATLNTSRYFGHWVMDELTRILAAPRVGHAVAPPRPLSTHQREYLKIMELSQHVRTDVRFRRLVILEERNQNAYRRERYSVLRERARRGRHAVPCTGVMLLRRQTGISRILVNEDDLADRLARLGFTTMCPMDYTVDEIFDACMDAPVVIGVEGSHLVHALLVMRERGTLLTLQPPNRFNNILKTYCDGLGLRYAFTVGHQRENGFFVDPDQVVRLLDLLPRVEDNGLVSWLI